MYAESFIEYHQLKAKLYKRALKTVSVDSIKKGVAKYTNGNRRVEIQLTVYENAKQKLGELRQEMVEKMKALSEVRNFILYANASHEQLKAYETIHGEVEGIHARMDQIMLQMNEAQRMRYMNGVEMKQTFDMVKESQSQLYDEAMLPRDDASATIRATETYIKAAKAHDIESKRNALDDSAIKMRMPVFLTIQEGNVIVTMKKQGKSKGNDNDEVEEDNAVDNAVDKADEKAAKEAPPTINLDIVSPKKKHTKEAKKKFVQDALDVLEFRFANKEECASLKRSAKHYMSKDDIVQVIESKPDLVRRIPEYKKLSKNDLCEVLFKEAP